MLLESLTIPLNEFISCMEYFIAQLGPNYQHEFQVQLNPFRKHNGAHMPTQNNACSMTGDIEILHFISMVLNMVCDHVKIALPK